MRIPSTKDLRAFELVARLGSLKAAAEQMHLTPSALSRRIQCLEEELGHALFIRHARGLSLTEAGQNYAKHLKEIFRNLEEVTSALKHNKKQCLKIVAPSLITSAIVPNLASFEQNFPDIALEIEEQVASLPSDLSHPDADLVFSWGSGQWSGWASQTIAAETYVYPLCSPRLLHKKQFLSTEEIPQYPWIISAHFQDGWKHWYEALGIPFPKPLNVIKVTNGRMAGEAAHFGQGLIIALGIEGFPALGIILGALVYAHPFQAMVPGHGFHLHSRIQNYNSCVPHFIQWFFSEVWNPPKLQQTLASIQGRQTL